MKEVIGRDFMNAPDFGKTMATEMDLLNTQSETAVEDGSVSDDFEFAFTSVESDPGALTGSPADEIFSNGRILPVYPVFNQDLVSGGREKSGEEELAEGMGRLQLSFEKRNLRSDSVSSSSTSSEAGDQDDLPSSKEEYCIWTPRSGSRTPDRWKKSSSTGSEAPEFRRFRLRDLVVGRSQSDGKEKLKFLPVSEKEMKRVCSRPNPSRKATAEAEKGKSGKEKGKGRVVREVDVATAHQAYYGKRVTGVRRSFLPYRPDLLTGIFGHRKLQQF